jgi:hypothetical protein
MLQKIERLPANEIFLMVKQKVGIVSWRERTPNQEDCSFCSLAKIWYY